MDRILRTWSNYPESTRNHHKLSARDFGRTSCTVGLCGRMCDDGVLGPREFTLVTLGGKCPSVAYDTFLQFRGGKSNKPKTPNSSFHFVFPCPKTILLCRNIIRYNPFVMDTYVG